jgi:hypothetical protein
MPFMKFTATCLFLLSALPLLAEASRQISGIYPNLAIFNNEGECGTGRTWFRFPSAKKHPGQGNPLL